MVFKLDDDACLNCDKSFEGEESPKKCGACLSASYCCNECQTTHWKTGGHKAQCKGQAVTALSETLTLLGGESAVVTLWGMRLASSAANIPNLERLVALTWTLRGASRNMVRLHLAGVIGYTAACVQNDLSAGPKADHVSSLLLRAIDNLEWPTTTEEQHLLSGFTTAVMILGEVPGCVPKAMTILRERMPKLEGWADKQIICGMVLQIMGWVVDLLEQTPLEDGKKRMELAKEAVDIAAQAVKRSEPTRSAGTLAASMLLTQLVVKLLVCGNKLLALHQPAAAVALLKTAATLAVGPDRAHAYRMLSRALRAAGRLEEALFITTKVAEAPNMTPVEKRAALVARAELLLDLGEKEEAWKAVEAAVEIEENKDKPDEMSGEVFSMRRALGLKADLLEDKGGEENLLQAMRTDALAVKIFRVANPGSRHRTAKMCVLRGRDDDALKCLRLAMEELEKDEASGKRTSRDLIRQRDVTQLMLEVLVRKDTPEAETEAEAFVNKVKEAADKVLQAREAALVEVKELSTVVLSKENADDDDDDAALEAGMEGLQVEEKKEAAVATKAGRGAAVAGGNADEEGDDKNKEKGEEEGEESGVCKLCERDLHQAGCGTVGDLYCEHSFHDNCLDIWAGKCAEKRIHSTCPTCPTALARYSASSQ